MKLYYFPASSNCRKVLAVIEHLGLHVDKEIVDVTKGKGQEPGFLAINPNGKIPTLVDGDLNLWESNAIASYLCSQTDTELWPKSHARYDIMRWMYWQTAHWGPACDTFAFENVLKPILGLGEPDPAALAKGAENVARFGAVLNNHLEGKTYICGDTLTLADFAVGAHLTYMVPGKIPMDGFARVMAWNERLNEVPAWAKTMPQT